MPDAFGFTHEPHFGTVFNRCVECDEYPWGVSVPAKERERHHLGHERDRKKEAARRQKANLALARKVKTLAHRENRVYHEGE